MATLFFKVNPAGSYLSDKQAEGPKAIAPTQVLLSSLGVRPGDNLSLSARGDFKAWEGGFDKEEGLLGVFVDRDGRYIQPDVYKPIFTQNQFSNKKTDIAEDFEIYEGFFHNAFTVPANAYAILFSVDDVYYSDNTDPDGDFGVVVRTGQDAFASGSDLLREIDRISQKSGKDDDGGGIPLFNYVDVKPFIGQKWGSQLNFESASGPTFRVSSAEGSTLELLGADTASLTSTTESFVVNLRNFAGDKLDLRFTGIYAGDTESKKLDYHWVYVGTANTQADDVDLKVAFESFELQNNSSNTYSGKEENSFDIRLAMGDQVTGYRYQVKGSEAYYWGGGGGVKQEDGGTTRITVTFSDFKAGLDFSGDIEKKSDYTKNENLITFSNFTATDQGKFFAPQSLVLKGGKELDHDLADIYLQTPFFRNNVLSKLTGEAIAGGGAGGGTAADGSALVEAKNSAADEVFIAPVGVSNFSMASTPLSQVEVKSPDGGKTWTVKAPGFGTDTLIGFKRLQLADAILAMDFSKADPGHSAVTMIGAAFGPSFIQTYFGAGVALFDNGKTKLEVARLIVDLGFIESIVGSTNSAWVTHVYRNVVGVNPDAFTTAAYASLLADGTHTRTSLLTLASEVPLLETQINLVGLQSDGLAYQGFM